MRSGEVEMKNKYFKNFKYVIHYQFDNESENKFATLAKTLFKAFLKIRKLKRKGHKFVSMEVINDEE